jgi:hypothetical protein
MCARKRSHIFTSRRTWVSVTVILLIVGYLAYMRYWLPKQASTDVFSLLQNNGYTPNPAFSGLLRPGNIIQVTELGTGAKEHQMAIPLVFAWADECFPDQFPRTQEFTLPQGTGSSSAGLSVSREAAARLIPSLNLQSEAVADYSLRLENTRVQAFAKGDLSGSFSKPCVAKLKTAIRAGDKIEWFKLILASVVADAVTLQVQWKENSSADVRSRVMENAQNALANTGVPTSGPARDSGLKVGITNNSKKETTISAKGFVIIGYQARPIQPDTNP